MLHRWMYSSIAVVSWAAVSARATPLGHLPRDRRCVTTAARSAVHGFEHMVARNQPFCAASPTEVSKGEDGPACRPMPRGFAFWARVRVRERPPGAAR